MKNTLLALYRDTLFRNSFFLLLSAGVVAAFGFVFWLIAARLFPPESIGLAATLIAAMTFIATLSLVGFDTVFIRFLPKSKEQNEMMNTGLLVVALSAVAIATLFLVFAQFISPVLGFVREGIFLPLAFIFFCVMTALNVLTDSIFLANRAAKYTFYINGVSTLCRLFLLLGLVRFGTMGIFLAVALSQTIATLLSLLVMRVKCNYSPSIYIHGSIVAYVRNYSAGNYLGGILNLLPATVLPILVANRLGLQQAAFYSIVMLIGNLLYALPWTVTRSLFAEGSHDHTTLAKGARKSLAVMCVFLLPAVLFFCLFGDRFLELFGKSYSLEGFHFLQLVALTAIGVYALSLIETFFRVTNNPSWLILINLVYFIVICGGSYLLLPLGLLGIGLAWFAGHVASSVVSFIILKLVERPRRA